ncbi:MAG: hypothetical protein MI749_02740 [Desulfovibrionales bacterium]|nr:hypothetical protein [Desulfovibrionales bacterium]
MNYQKAESITELFWQKSRNPLTFWPRVILTLLIFIAFWMHAIWWIIFLVFVEAAVLFFAPPPANYDHWMTRATDGFRIWNTVRSPSERTALIIQILFGFVALLASLWGHRWFWVLFFAVQIGCAKYILGKRFIVLSKLKEYDIKLGPTQADLQHMASRCTITN